MNLRMTAVAAVAVAMPVFMLGDRGAAVSTSCSATNLVDDTFDGSVLNRCKWDEVSQSGGRFATNGELVATTDPMFAFSIPRLTSQYRLTGDADLQVDVRTGEGWTGGGQNSGVEAQMAFYWDDAHYIQIGRGRDAGGDYIKPYTPIEGQGGINGTRINYSRATTKLRLVRTGTTIVLRYFDGNAWNDLALATGPDEPAYIYIGSIAANMSGPTTAYFDNFRLNAGPTSFHPFTRTDHFTRRPDLFLGGVVCDYLPYSNFGGNQWQGINPLDTMKQNGMKWVRVGVTTVSSPTLRDTPPEQWTNLSWQPEFWSSREFAGEIMRQAQQRGYRLNLFLFLSNMAAHAGQQNAPPEWAGLSVSETAQRVDQYSFESAAYYRDRGLNVEIYDIGNEIDFGILNFRPGDRIPIPPGTDIVNNVTWMRENVWNVEAQLLQASIAGIRRANPNAKIVLHASGVNVGRSNIFVKSFFKAMSDFGVDYDYAGLSNPYNAANWTVPDYSTDCWFQRLHELIDYLGTLNKKVIFSEASYPGNAQGTSGAPMPEFAYSPEGQAAWTHQYLRFLSNQPNVRGFFWFYPDYHTQQNVDPTLRYGGLFRSPTEVQPAQTEFRVNLGSWPFDYDNDGLSDLSVFRPSTGAWYTLRSNGGGLSGVQFGTADDRIAPADYEGDGNTDVAVYRPSTGIWYVFQSSDGTVNYFVFGLAEDLPTPGDYDGDGKADVSVFRPSTGTWYRQNSSDGSLFGMQFGASGDKPALGDYDGDGKSDIAVFRPADGAWYWVESSDSSSHGEQFGVSDDLITPGDYDGDGKTDLAVFRPSTGFWYTRNSNGSVYTAYPFGLSDDIPAPGDFDGDGKTDYSVFRRSDGNWYRINSTDGSFSTAHFGQSGDNPTQSAFIY